MLFPFLSCHIAWFSDLTLGELKRMSHEIFACELHTNCKIVLLPCWDERLFVTVAVISPQWSKYRQAIHAILKRPVWLKGIVKVPKRIVLREILFLHGQRTHMCDFVVKSPQKKRMCATGPHSWFDWYSFVTPEKADEKHQAKKKNKKTKKKSPDFLHFHRKPQRWSSP